MKISGIKEDGASQAGRLGAGMTEDSFSKSLKNEIAQKQKQLQELSNQENLTMEEKMKKRQDLQKEINDLNNQLRQHEIEVRKEQQTKKASMDGALGGPRKNKAETSEKQNSGFSQAGMQAIISADSAMKQAKVQGSVATDQEGRGRVLEIEIRLDGARGGSTEAKQEELAEVEQRAQEATASQVSTLSEANKAMEEAGTEEETVKKMEKTEEPNKTNKRGEERKQEENAVVQEGTMDESQQAGTYRSVDIYL